MIQYNDIIEAQQSLVEHWGEAGKRVIEECAKVTPYNNTFNKFLNECTACGGNWGGMFLTGVQRLYPEVWDAIPDDMGVFAFADICSTLILLGIDCSTDD